MLVKIIKQLCLLLLLLPASCSRKDESGDIKPVPLHVSRLEQTLFENGKTEQSKLARLRSQFGSFADLYLMQVLGLKADNDSILAGEIEKYVNDRYIKEVYDSVNARFGDLQWLEDGLASAFGRYHYYFPGKIIPYVVTFIAPFSYNAIATDSTLGIGLDMYLGPEFAYYLSAGFPLYKIKKLDKGYILKDAVSAWLQSDYTADSAKNLLDNMIYEGKILYYTGRILNETPDTVKFGYSQQQLEWCRENEKNVWQFFIEQKLLFNNNPGEYIKFINEGAGTSGFPKEAPARLGAYIGLQIVNAFMEKHDMTAEQFMAMNDGNAILIESGYKPGKH